MLNMNDPIIAATVANLPKISRSIPVAIPAGILFNGQIQPGQAQLMATGTRFYVRACSAPINIQSQRAGNAGSQNLFGTAQGQTVNGGFEQLNVSNPTLLPIVALIWVGFEDFINNQLVLDNVAAQNVVWATSQVDSAGNILIPDLSGTKQNVNGKAYYFLNRQAVLIANNTAGTTFVLQAVTNPVTVAPFPGFFIYPLTSLNIPSSGDFSMSVGGGAITARVWELYQAFAA